MIHRIRLSDLWATPSFVDPTSSLADPNEPARVRTLYSFIGESAVDVTESEVVLSRPDIPDAKAKEAAEIATRGARRAASGDFAKAADQLKRAIEINPLGASVYRDFAMALIEMGQHSEAQEQLRRLLLLNPTDAWAWVILGNLTTKQLKNPALAKRYFERAIQLAPDDIYARNSLAAIHAESGNLDAAKQLFNEIITVQPKFAHAYFGLATAEGISGNHETAFETLLQMFSRADRSDRRANHVFREATKMLEQIAGALAGKHVEKAEAVVEHLRLEAERLTGYRVEFGELSAREPIFARTELAWSHNRDFHRINVRSGLSAAIANHLQAHELYHILLEGEARVAGKNRTISTAREEVERAIASMGAEIPSIKRAMKDELRITQLLRQLVEGLVSQTYNIPLDMTIERIISERHPELKYSQFAAEKRILKQAFDAISRADIASITPRRIHQASTVLNAAYALAADDRWNGATMAAAGYREFGILERAERLKSAWRAMDSKRAPGDEYAIVDAFAEELRIENWFHWRVDTARVEDKNRPSGTTNPELLQEKLPAAVFHFLSVLKRFDTLSLEDIRTIAFEAAMLGQSGLDYASPNKKYQLKSVRDEELSGLQVMCYMYAGFQRIAPGENLGMDLNDAYLQALKLREASK